MPGLDFSLYVVTGESFSAGRTTEQVVRAAIAGGAGAIQLREKDWAPLQVFETACRLREITAEAGVTFIINDRLDIALAAGADGVHLGQTDLPIQAARQLAGPDFIIGASTHSLEQALVAQSHGASYLNIGPLFPTSTKQHTAPPVRLSTLQEVVSRIDIPVTTMGGINAENISSVVAAGADRVAVVSAVTAASDITKATQLLCNLIKSAQRDR